MNFYSIVILYLLSIAIPQSLEAKEYKTYFYSNQKQEPFSIETEYVAVSYDRSSHSQSEKKFSSKAIEQFHQLGVSIAKRSYIKDYKKIIGYPLLFNYEQHSIGVLTHEIIFKIKNHSSISQITNKKGFTSLEKVNFADDVYLAKFSSPLKALNAANLLYESGTVIYAHPNFLIPKDFRKRKKMTKFTSNPLFAKQWHLKNTGQTGGTKNADISILGAWKITQGKPSVVVAVIDGGFEIAHPDLKDSWYTNKAEIPGDKIDNDHNGLIDDVHGWNFAAESPDHMMAVYPHHGTSVAGLVGAKNNTIGTIGSCPNCTLLPITSSYTPKDDVQAFYYAAEQNADIISNSWGYPIYAPRTDAVTDAIKTVSKQGRDGKGTIILFAMNNRNIDDCIGKRPDISSLKEVIAISASSDKDEKIKRSGWGECMDFISPTWQHQHQKGGIVTTDLLGSKGYNPVSDKHKYPDQDYTLEFSGTSAATPIAAGVIGLMLSVNPDLSLQQVYNILKETSTKVQPKEAKYDKITGFSKKYGYGRINAAKAVEKSLYHYSKKKTISSGSDKKRTL